MGDLKHACDYCMIKTQGKNKGMAIGHREKRYSLSIIRDVSKLELSSGDFAITSYHQRNCDQWYKSNELGQHPKNVHC